MNRLIESIEGEIKRIDRRRNNLDSFDEKNTVSLNRIVCHMKHAASANPEVFRQWLSEQPADINPTIMDRFVLYDQNAKHSDKM